MMGGIAAGKTTIRDLLVPAEAVRLCADEWKYKHPEFDPKNCSRGVHLWSMRKLAEQFEEVIAGDDSFVMDGTGIAVDRTLAQIEAAKRAGFEVRLICVVTSLSVCLKRNRSRDRFVDEGVIREKNRYVQWAFKAVAPHADFVTVVLNDGEPVVLENPDLKNLEV